MASIMDTFNDMFGGEIEENNRIDLGNSISRRLAGLGFSFEECQAIQRGEMQAELPQDLTSDLAEYLKVAEAKEEADEELTEKETQQDQAKQAKIRTAYNKMISGQRLTNSQVNLLIQNGYAKDCGHVGGETEAHTWQPTGKKL